MKIKLFHGSDHIIESPQFGAGKPYNDYGLGFYCTESLDMAKEWGVGADRDGYANCYELDNEGLYILDLNSSDFCILHWLSILLENRVPNALGPLAVEAMEYLRANFGVDYRSADAIVGYRADDSYFSFAQDFLNGAISYRQLNNAMHLGKLGRQFVLKSRQAFGRLEYVGYETASSAEWYAKKFARDQLARREYLDVERNRRRRGDIYIAQILDEEMKPDDPRIR